MGTMSLSSTFTTEQRREMGLKEVLSDIGLPDLRIGWMTADFQIDGRLASLREVEKVCQILDSYGTEMLEVIKESGHRVF